MTPQLRIPFVGDYPISLKFGVALDWIVKQQGYPHAGIDFAMPTGTAIKATDDGEISYADNVPDANGLGINMVHAWGMSQYWHLSVLYAKYGEHYKKGETIGLSGNSGWSTGPHLHFGVKVIGESSTLMRGWSDPAKYWEKPIAVVNPPAISPKTYMILPGDTLWKIAAKFYGNGIYWNKIYQANIEKISNPNIIRAFTLIRIP
jgi:murein DD-endopeptidase MepM/ murein hydrolase activator NlpD